MIRVLTVLAVLLLVPSQEGKKPKDDFKRKMQDKAGGVPQEILDQQSLDPVKIPSLEEACKMALEAGAGEAVPLIDVEFHKDGKTLIVPDAYPTIQAAIDAATSGDTVLVRPGTYHELLVMKDGVKLTSDPGEKGDELVPVEGARMQLPRRALETIIDGSKAEPSHHGMIDFLPGVGRKTIVDGFTIQNLPKINHHVPGHAHGINVRGASPVIMNCLIRNNGSTGIGNHVVYKDQKSPMPERDFRWDNIEHRTSAVILRNVLHGQLGLGVGCNHFSEPFILANEVFGNDDSELGDDPTPGIGGKHGSAATVIGNIVHDNPGGGILCRVGVPQGKHPIDRPTHPTIQGNVVYDNGPKRPGISSNGGGSEGSPVKITGNWVYNAGAVGIGLSQGAVGIVEGNKVSDSTKPGIAIHGSTALKLNGNQVRGSKEGPGIVITEGAKVLEMKGNAAEANAGPRFVLKNGTIGKGKGKEN